MWVKLLQVKHDIYVDYKYVFAASELSKALLDNTIVKDEAINA
jgi:hypothetical protein